MLLVHTLPLPRPAPTTQADKFKLIITEMVQEQGADMMSFTTCRGRRHTHYITPRHAVPQHARHTTPHHTTPRPSSAGRASDATHARTRAHTHTHTHIHIHTHTSHSKDPAPLATPPMKCGGGYGKVILSSLKFLSALPDILPPESPDPMMTLITDTLFYIYRHIILD